MKSLSLPTENCSGMEFIHYGSKRFNPKKFEPIINFRFTKPSGGFWASPVRADFGWKDWCCREDFYVGRLAQSFTFTLSDDARVYRIRDYGDLRGIPMLNEWGFGDVLDDPTNPYPRMIFPDFEKMKEIGIDAIFVEISGDHRLYWALYGWDCDSIVIMNPDIIVLENP